MTSLSPLFILFLVIACGKPDTSEKREAEEIVRIDGSNIQGVYQTSLTAVNMNLTIGNVGSAGVHRSYDSFKAFVKVFIADKGVHHRQSIHLGSRCPTPADDINGDGYVDLREAHFVVGNILIPLDGDLDSQSQGSSWYPQGNGVAGGYFYERSASFSRMFEDLRDTDANTLDTLEKLPYDQGVSLNKKVILISGVSSSTWIPDSVDTMSGLSRHSSLPIACGILTRTDRFPSELYDRTDPITVSERPTHVRIRPRTPEHREPEIIPLPEDPAPPPRNRPLRQRIRCWFRRDCVQKGQYLTE
ncbi:MAG: hypothetical protein V4598_04465 [Bdellovibrionota bacterium]